MKVVPALPVRPSKPGLWLAAKTLFLERLHLGPPVVRSVRDGRHPVRVALAESRAGDADELRVLHLLDRRGTAVAHRLAQPADELVEYVRDRALVRHTALDPLRDQLVDVLDIALEVAVLRVPARLHRAE